MLYRIEILCRDGVHIRDLGVCLVMQTVLLAGSSLGRADVAAKVAEELGDLNEDIHARQDLEATRIRAALEQLAEFLRDPFREVMAAEFRASMSDGGEPPPLGFDIEWVTVRKGRLAPCHRPKLRAIPYLANAGCDRIITLLSKEEGAEEIGVTVEDAVQCACSPSGGLVASCGTEGVSLWDSSSGQLEGLLEETQGIKRIAFSPDGRHLAAFHSGRVLLFDLQTKDRVKEISGLLSGTDFAWSSDGWR